MPKASPTAASVSGKGADKKASPKPPKPKQPASLPAQPQPQGSRVSTSPDVLAGMTTPELGRAVNAEFNRVSNRMRSDISAMIDDSLSYAASKADGAGQPLAQGAAVVPERRRAYLQLEWLRWYEEKVTARAAPGSHMDTEWHG